MRVLFLGNNWVAWQLARCLREQGDGIVGLVLHPAERRTYGEQIVAASGVSAYRVFEGPELGRPETLRAIASLEPEIGVSALFGYILRRECLDLFPSGCINVHPALLPWNRGAYPNVWSLVDGTPAGATIHYVDEGVDTGDIIAQREVSVEPTDTGESLYRRLERACVELFRETWPRIRSGDVSRTPQDKAAGTTHRVRDVRVIDEIVPDRLYPARELIDRIRARTFIGYQGAYIRVGGKKVYLRLGLLDEDDIRREND
jgi:methionyl-tRNA formyltransferase